ncbi:hypothetical protein SDC9_71448 [bioreactor metagenome]|uniref:Uncharacterized protein n=1 Tax=bioreactor metagenome TaxID=1076179 RepID=A0A644Y9H1_9ZZZZ
MGEHETLSLFAVLASYGLNKVTVFLLGFGDTAVVDILGKEQGSLAEIQPAVGLGEQFVVSELDELEMKLIVQYAELLYIERSVALPQCIHLLKDSFQLGWIGTILTDYAHSKGLKVCPHLSQLLIVDHSDVLDVASAMGNDNDKPILFKTFQRFAHRSSGAGELLCKIVLRKLCPILEQTLPYLVFQVFIDCFYQMTFRIHIASIAKQVSRG